MTADQQQNPFAGAGSPFGAASQFRNAARVRFVQLQREQSLGRRILGTILLLILIGLGVIIGVFALAIGLVAIAVISLVVGTKRLFARLGGSSSEGRSNVRVIRTGQR